MLSHADRLVRLLSRTAVAVAIALVTLSRTPAQSPRARVEAQVVVPPIPVSGTDGERHLSYELRIVGVTGTDSARLDRVDVFRGNDKQPLMSYSSGDLDGRVMHPDADPSARYSRTIQAGATALVHIWITTPGSGPAPTWLRHAFVFQAEDGSPIPAAELRVEVRATPPLVLGPPFRAGTGFLAHNGPGNHRSPHWGSALVDDRGARVPQRYAIDFIGVDDNGRAVRGDVQKSSNEDWIGFGTDVLAVVDGLVYAARDGVPDNRPLAELPRPSSPSAADTYGNYVILSLGDGTFVHYAHLQRGSVAVTAGQPVRRGQLLGRLGNSGNTNGPHLHFNVTNDPAPERSQGLPFVFDTCDPLGTTTVGVALGADPSSPAPRLQRPTRRRALPLDGALVRFP